MDAVILVLVFFQLELISGEVYMKAWAQSGGAFRTLLEDNLQKLMDGGMLINRVKQLNLAKNVGT